jgi:hypothetical protein
VFFQSIAANKLAPGFLHCLRPIGLIARDEALVALKRDPFKGRIVCNPKDFDFRKEQSLCK